MKIILGLLFSAIFLFGCNQSTNESDTSKIGLGMDENQVVTQLGEPDYRTTDRNELTSEYNNLSTIHAMNVEFSDEENEDIVYERLGDISTAINEERNVEVFEYQVSNEYKIIVYFTDNAVSHFYEIDLSQ